MYFTKVFVSALLGAVASAQTVHVVSVGSANNSTQLTFSPDNVKANTGDMIQFQFRSGNHTVTQSTFDQPCMPISMFTNNTGIWSGFQPVKASEAQGTIPTYTIMINNTNPLWFYCSQGKHCQNGMVMVVNENTAKNSTRSLENFKALAKSATVNVPGGATSSNGGSTGSTTGSGSGSASGTGSTTIATGSAQSGVADTAAGVAIIVPTTMSLFGIAAALFLL